MHAPYRRQHRVEVLEDRRVLAPVLVVPDLLPRSGGVAGIYSHGWADGESVEYDIIYSNQTTSAIGYDVSADYHGISEEAESFGGDPLGTATIIATGDNGGVATAEVTIVDSHSGTFSDLRVIAPGELIRGNTQEIYTMGWWASDIVTYEITWPNQSVSSADDVSVYANGLSSRTFSIPGNMSEGIATLVATGDDSGLELEYEFMVKAMPGSGPPALSVPQYVIPDENYTVTGTRFAVTAYFYVIQGEEEWSVGSDAPDSHARVDEVVEIDEDVIPWQPATIEARNSSGVVLATARVMVVEDIPVFSEFISGIIGSVPILDVAMTYDITATELAARVPENGVIEDQSLAERTVRGIVPTDGIVRTGLTYFDSERGVDIYAPEDYYFVEYSNGAVEVREIPSGLPGGQAHPFVSEISPITRSLPNLGVVPKPVLRTGLTFFDPARGLDVTATSGKYLIEYVDGKVEERNLPTGGFVPRPSDFGSGGSDNSVAKSTLGPTLAQLGLTVSGGAPKPSSQLWLLGKEYVASNGQVRVAHDGNIFLQDPTTGIILERPEEDESVALEKPAPTERTPHDSEDVSDLFEDAYGRLPNPFELQYWTNRTDKSGAALLGAMESAYADGVTVSVIPRASTPQEVDEVFAMFDGQEITQYNPESWTWDWVVNGVEQQVENFSDFLSDQADAYHAFMDRLFTFPVAPTNQAELDFYLSNPDYVVEVDILPSSVTSEMHDGGVTSIRIRQRGSLSGIQVVLDANGDIIPPGEPGTGSPDLYSPTNPLLIGWHFLLDVAPWAIGVGANSLSSLWDGE